MSINESKTYKQTGIASWYGNETLRQKGGHMTANGETFNPHGLSAAHKYLPLSVYIRVTNLKNNKSIIVRVNDRGPFIDDRKIDLSSGAAKNLDFTKTAQQESSLKQLKDKGKKEGTMEQKTAWFQKKIHKNI